MSLSLIALGGSAFGATVFTDLEDYPPGDTVQITGTDFWAGETVIVQITHIASETPDLPAYDPWDVIANSYGIFDTYWEVPEEALAESLLVTATGQTSGEIATTSFTDCNTVLVINSALPDSLCAGEPVEYCVTLYQACGHGNYAPLPNRPILFFLNDDNCGVNVGQGADDTVYTDINGVACFNTTAPIINGTYAFKAKFLGEDKPDYYEPPNSACNPTKKVQLSASNYCEEIEVSDQSSACNAPPVVVCPGDTSIFACDLSEICIPGFSSSDPDGNLQSVTVSTGYINGNSVCFTPTGSGTYTITMIATDDAGLADTCTTVVTLTVNSAPTCSLPSDATFFVCADTTFSYPISATDIDGNLTGCTLTSGSGTLAGGYWTFTTSGSSVYSATFECTDNCGATCSGTVNITVNQNTPPVITCPADLTIECDASIDPSNTGTATATDDYDPNPTITYSDNETVGACSQEKVITRTWTATDNCGGSSQCVQTITVVDTTDPIISCPANVTVECDGSIDPSNTGTATATDNCDATVTVTYADVVVGNAITRTWTATDDCGNSATCDQTITLQDTTDPIISCPADLTIECDASIDPSNTGTATATDNCSTPTVTYSDTETAGSCPQEKVITRTWTATDAASNTAACVQTITVVDTTDPVISCPADLTIECDASTDPSNTGTATATDNCDATVDITYADVVVGNVITRTWTATDDCGNSATCDQTITIADTTDPVISCPADLMIECDASTDPANTGSATATDNCSTPTVTYSDTETAGSCPQEKVITRTWMATDAASNTAICVQTITVVDTTDPVISCPADVTVECDGSIDPSATGTVTATDNCDATVDITYADVTVGNVITRTWTATDDCGNSATCDQTITIDDTTDPVISCPADLTIECDASTDPANTGTATATDNCTASPVITYSDTETAGSCPQEKVITRTWMATDAASNAATCVQTITVVDTTDPVISCPANVSVECDASIDPSNTGFATATDNCDATVAITYADVTVGNVITRTWTATDDCGNTSTCDQTITIEDTTDPVISCPADLTIECDASIDPSNTGTATATDNCSTPTVTYSDVIAPGACDQAYTITRTWTATDAASNTATCVQTITVVDTTDPIISCPADIDIECSASTDPSNTGTATATDNCDPNVTITYADDKSLGTITRTWIATDACGNSVSCDQVITVDDTTDPVISCPADITIECDASTDPSNTGTATATDNCDTNPVVSYSDSETAGSCPQEKVITRTWTATDHVGNASTCVQTITVVDTTDPVISCPADVTVECDASIDPSNTGTATATDNCDVTVAITYSDVTVGNVITRTWTATDDCGNTSTCDQTITIEDTTDPVISCPADLTIECDASIDPANTGTATATDNCDASPVVTYSDAETAGSCAQEKIITRTWTATDADNNTATCVQTITVVDTTDPVISCPADVDIECDASTDPSNTGYATATDNCDPSVTITYADDRSLGVITRTWTATDDCGNSATCEQTITVDDTVQPTVLSCPPDLTIDCDVSLAPSSTGGEPTGEDNCSPDLTVTYSDSETAGSCPQEKTITRTWTLTDGAGNFTTCTQVISVVDNGAPVITCPDDVTVECDGSTDPSVTGTATAIDNCDGDITISYADVVNGDIITRTWTATDACDNSVSCDQIITLEDTTDPVVSCPSDLTLDCDSDTDPANTGSATATDNCDTAPVITYDDVITPGACPQAWTITRTWTATDADNNSASCDQIITITDNIPPVVTCPPDINIECNASTDPSNTGTATATDICDPNPTVDYSDAVNSGSIVRTWTVTDACGNSVSCDQTITIDDTVDPVITCPATAAVECGASTDPSVTGTATATDNCTAEPVITYSDEFTTGTCEGEGTITRTWTATDNSGNTATCQQTIVISDTTPPTVSCPADISVECDSPTDPSATGTATGTDNCTATVTITYSDIANGTVITRTWTATDDCGNSATCDQTITIVDTTPPELTCPDPIEIDCDVDTDPSVTGMATATDNCDPNPVVTYSDVENAGSCPNERFIIRTWTATDADNNTVTCEQNITVRDLTAPVITCPADATIQCDGAYDPSVTGTATATDNCSTPTVTFADSKSATIVTRTWVATDACGNSSSCNQTITIEGDTPPIATCPGAFSTGAFEFPAEICVSGFSCTDADDNIVSCEVNLGTLTGNQICFTAPEPGVYSVTLTVTDDCGNTSSCMTEIMVAQYSNCPIITIEKTHNTLQGHYENVSVFIENATYDMGGFDFLIAYDASALTATDVAEGDLLGDCGWEYFTYRFGPFGNCGTGCPTGMLHVLAMAEQNNGQPGPTCYGPPDAGRYELFNINFLISNDRTLECQYVPIKFFWLDCGDNSISAEEGELLYIDSKIYDFTGYIIWDETDDIHYSESNRLPNVGAPDSCLNYDPEKPSAIRCIEFVNGGVDIVCADSIDARGDVNLNGVANELSDAVVYTNYFIYGMAAFTINPEGQIAASDVNADGTPLSVADLTYLIRILIGDCLPIPKLNPNADLKVDLTMSNGIVTIVSSDEPVGAMQLVFDGNVIPSLTTEASHMTLDYNYDGKLTRVLVSDPDNGASLETGLPVLNLNGEYDIVSIDIGSYDGVRMAANTVIRPDNYRLYQNFPNPFNPLTSINFDLPVAAEWHLTIFNVLGNKVADWNGHSEAGSVNVEWDASEHASGVYFYRLSAGEFADTKKMVLLK